jgi:hypothetical protein
MNHENTQRLAFMAAADCRHGGAQALTLAKRAARLTGSTEAGEIVSTVYTRGGVAGYTCHECGGWHLERGEAADCCAPDWED